MLVELLKQLGGGAVTTAIFLVVYLFFQWLAKRTGAGVRTKTADIAAGVKREEITLTAESQALERLERQLDRAEAREAALRADLESLRGTHRLEIVAIRHECDERERALENEIADAAVVRRDLEQRLDIAEAAKNEALLDAINTRGIAQDQQARDDFEKGHLRAELVAATWREKGIRATFVQLHELATKMRLKLLEYEDEDALHTHLPGLPRSLVDDEPTLPPRQLPPGDSAGE